MTTATALTCPSCGAPVAPGDAFCEACGNELPAKASAAGQPAPPAADPVTMAGPGGAGARPCVSCGAPADQIIDGYCNQCGMKQPAPRDHIEATPAAGVAAVTDRGRRHPRNEDAFSVTVTAAGRVLAVVCDGVSTSTDPDVASQAAVDAALASLAEAGEEPWPLLPAQTSAYDEARNAVLAVPYNAGGPYGPPACTYLAAAVERSTVSLSTLGDCRAFWLPAGGGAEALTDDDSWAADKVRSGAMSPDEAYHAPDAHLITRWLGRDADPTWEPHHVDFTARAAGRLVVCSDGLWTYAIDPAGLATAAGAGTAIEVARRLVTFANEQGGHDNITVVVVDLPVSPSRTAVSGAGGGTAP
jgi:serine/threonine protein phosphatase PrpC